MELLRVMRNGETAEGILMQAEAGLARLPPLKVEQLYDAVVAGKVRLQLWPCC